MSENKKVRKSVVVALGVVCIILVALTAYFTYSNINLQNQIDSLNSNLTNLQKEVNNLTDVINLQESTLWVNEDKVDITPIPVGEAKTLTYVENASFAGYVSVQISSQYNVVVEVSYLSHRVSYDDALIVSKSGTATFPVLPSSNISFYIYVTFEDGIVISGPLYATVTITYYY